MTRKYWLILILLFGLALRLISINQSLWLDEAISVEVAAKYSLSGLFSKFLPSDFNPPFYYLILHFWLKIFPATEFFIRLPSLIFGILTCWTIYKISELIFKNKKSNFFSLILLTTSPLHIYYSQEARAYSLTAFLVSASMYFFIKCLKGSKVILFTLYSLLFTLSCYSHYLSWLILFTQLFYLLVWQRSKMRRFFTVYCLLFTVYLPWLPVFLKQLKGGREVAQGSSVWRHVLGGPSFKNIVLLPIKFIIGRTSFDNKLLYYFIISLLLLFFGFLLYQTCKQVCKKRSSRSKPGLERLIWFWLIVPPALGIIVSFKIPIFSYFRFLFCLPAFYILIAKGVSSFKNPKVLITAVLLINLFFSSRYLLNEKFHREDWKKAIQTLHEQNYSLDPVLIIQSVSAPFDYYDRGLSRKVFVYQKDAVSNFETVWLIPYSQPILDPNNETRSFLKNNGFSRIYEEHFRGVTLEKWEKLLAKN